MSDEQSGLGASNSTAISGITAGALPTSLRGKAARWLIKLVGGAVAAPLIQRSRESWDKMEGRSKVNSMLAEEVGRRAIADPDLMERAKAHFLSDTFRKQENVEKVASQAATILENVDVQDDNLEVDYDWMNVFARYAEDASSEKMQELWGKVLAGEIRNSGSFSPATMRVLSELDRSTAEDVGVILNYIIDDHFIKTAEWQRGELFTLASRLEAAGIVNGAVSLVNREYKVNKGPMIFSRIEGKSLMATFNEEKTFTIDIVLLTPVGRQIIGLQKLPSPEERLRRVALELKKHGAVKAAIVAPHYTSSQYYEQEMLYGS